MATHDGVPTRTASPLPGQPQLWRHSSLHPTFTPSSTPLLPLYLNVSHPPSRFIHSSMQAHLPRLSVPLRSIFPFTCLSHPLSFSSNSSLSVHSFDSIAVSVSSPLLACSSLAGIYVVSSLLLNLNVGLWGYTGALYSFARFIYRFNHSSILICLQFENFIIPIVFFFYSSSITFKFCPSSFSRISLSLWWSMYMIGVFKP